MTHNNLQQLSPVFCASLEFNLELGVVANASGETQRLSPISLKLLGYLLTHHHQVVSRTELFDVIWPNQIISDDVLTRAVSDIRIQLAKLDANAKFIETLPKRGYRWCADIVPLANSEVIDSNIAQQNVAPIAQPADIGQTRGWIKNISIYFLLAFMVAGTFMWAISLSASKHVVSIAVLPALADRPSTELWAQTLDEALLKILRKNTQVKILSAAAIKSRPENPFPYFANEFGAAWVIESRITDLDGINNIELSLVDARTGLEVRNIHFDVTSRADILLNVAKKLETDLLIEQLP